MLGIFLNAGDEAVGPLGDMHLQKAGLLVQRAKRTVDFVALTDDPEPMIVPDVFRPQQV